MFPIPDFGTLHEISRHAIHVSEILSVTIETLRRLQSQQKVVYKHLPKGFLVRTYKEQAQEYLGFQLQLIESLKARSVANHDRLKNEIELVIILPSLLTPFHVTGNSSDSGIHRTRPPGQRSDEDSRAFNNDFAPGHLSGG